MEKKVSNNCNKLLNANKNHCKMNNLFVCILLTFFSLSAFAQDGRTVLLKSKSSIAKELFTQLVITKQVTQKNEYKFMYQFQLSTKAHIAGVDVYKFGINSPHAAYNLAFVHRDKVVFPNTTNPGQVFRAWGDFLMRYPTSFTVGEQRELTVKILDLLEHNQTPLEQDLEKRE